MTSTRSACQSRRRRSIRKAITAIAREESVNFAFEFNVPGGDMRLDLPLGVMRPEADQMPSACKTGSPWPLG